MTTARVEDGKTLTYTNGGSAIVAGQPVAVGNQIGIAQDAIANGATGVLLMDGVFNVPKVDAADVTVGQFLMWDASAGKFDDSAATPAAGDITLCVVAWETKGATVGATIKAKINVGVGTVA